jgi:uncharacterized protein YaaQ
MKPSVLDRLAILTVSGEHANALLERLTQEEFAFTVITNSQGILQDREICLLVGFHRDRLAILVDTIRNCCRPYRQYVPTQGFLQGGMTEQRMVEAIMGGARLSVVEVERFEQY